ncbi:MAG: MFS transporter [Myxococcales bacterium]|nr:MFS transporter [Myxococcales bacterium]
MTATPPGAAPEAPASWRSRIFAISWLSYFSYYFTRTNFSVAKKDISREFGFDKVELGWIDTASLGMYCLGQFVHGVVGEVLGPRRLIALGMLTSAALSVAFGTQSLLGVLILIWGLNGFVQATGWPGNGKLLASWFDTRRRGEMMGVWSTCYQAGGVAAKLVAIQFLVRFGWRWTFFGPALWVAVVGGAVFLLVRDRPSDVGFADPELPPMAGTTRTEELAVLRRAARAEVLRTTRIWFMNANYFCLKLMRYAFLYWLPFYLAEGYHYSSEKAGYVSIAFDAGGIPFVILLGIVADRVLGRRRILTAALSCVALCGAFALYREIGHSGVAWNILGLALIGGALFGADALVSGSASQDVGGSHASALACGLVNGIGSLGGIAQTFVLVFVTERWGWDGLFKLFMVLSLVGAALLAPFWRVRPTLAPTPTT